jgi:hypothetical protein
MNYLEENLVLLARTEALTREQAAVVRTAALPEAYRVFPSTREAGNETLSVMSGGRELMFHGEEAPEAQAAEFAMQVPDTMAGLLWMGAGLGYEPEAITRIKSCLRAILIVEQEPALLRAFLTRTPLSAVPNLQWFFWLGDLNDRFYDVMNRFHESVKGGSLLVLGNPVFEEYHARFVESLRHTVDMSRHGNTVRELINKAQAVNSSLARSPEYFMQKLFDVPFPWRVRIEPTNLCNLHCRMCPTPGYPREKKGLMSMELYNRIIDELRHIPNRDTFRLTLYLGGEPLLHPHLPDMVRRAADLGYATHINTNCMLLNEDISEKLIRAGLKEIFFSFDDTTPEEYERNRVGARREVVYENIRRFLDVRERLNSKDPMTVIACLKFPREGDTLSTHGQLVPSQELQALFEGLPVCWSVGWAHHWAGDFTADVDGMPPLAPLESYYPCSMPWLETTIRWDGTMVPCCYDLRSGQPLGRFPDQSLLELWNGPGLRGLRQDMVRGRAHTIPLCSGCSPMRDPSGLDDFFGPAASIYKHFIRKK